MVLDPRVEDNAEKIKQLEKQLKELKAWKEGHIIYHKTMEKKEA